MMDRQKPLSTQSKNQYYSQQKNAHEYRDSPHIAKSTPGSFFQLFGLNFSTFWYFFVNKTREKPVISKMLVWPIIRGVNTYKRANRLKNTKKDLVKK